MANLQRGQEEIKNSNDINVLDANIDLDLDLKQNEELSQEDVTGTSKEPHLQGFSNRSLVFVMSGIHKGAGCTVNNETTIGSDFDNELILTDDDIAAHHLVLTPIEDGLNYAIKVTCKGDNVVINDKFLLTQEQTIIMEETFVVIIGMVSINIALYKAKKTTIVYKKYIAPKILVVEELGASLKKYLSPTVIISDIRNIILLGFILLSIGISLAYYFTKAVPKSALQLHYTTIKPLTIKETSDNAELNIQAKNDLNQILKKYDLQARLNLFIKERVLYIQGDINNYELQNWSKVLNWFDTTYGMQVNIVPLITVNNGLRRTISFKAVVADGSMPYVVSWTGDRFRPGATLPGGWIILKIGDEGVVVKDAVDNRIFLVKHIRSQYGEAVPDFRE